MFTINLQPTFNSNQSLEQTANQQIFLDTFCNRFRTKDSALEVANTIKGGGVHFKCQIEKVKS